MQGSRQLGVIQPLPDIDPFIVESSADYSSDSIPPLLPPSRINYPDDCMKEEVVVTMSGEEKIQARTEHDDRNPMNSTVLEINETKSDFFS